jgi:hypothetical protein
MSDKPTREMILAEPAGRQMDVWVAKYIIELPDDLISIDGIINYPFHDQIIEVAEIPHYSEDIDAAWQVVEKLTRLEREPNPLYFRLTWGWWDKPHSEDSPQYWAVFDWKLTGDSHPLYLAIAETAPLAICRASLLAALLATLESESPCVYPTRQE